MYWNCRGFPWHKGVATNVLFGEADIILLGETWERSTCTLPQIPGYIVHSAMQHKRGHRGQGGVACIYRAHLHDRISVAKVDVHHRYIWLKITNGGRILTLGWMLDIKKRFAKWKLEKCLEASEVDWKEMERSFKTSLWDQWAASTKNNKFEYYCQHIMHCNKGSFH